MITLQKLLVTESDAAVGTQAGKAGDAAAQDFLSLLTGALSGAKGQADDAPLTLADLQAALGGKLEKGKLAALTHGEAQSPAQKLADLLARQSDKATLTADVQVTADVQKLLSSLTPTAKNDVLAALNKSAQASDDKTDFSNDDLAGLSALMAMLPHQQSAQLNTRAQPANAAGSADVAAAASRALGTVSPGKVTDEDLQASVKGDTANADKFQLIDNSQQNAPLTAAIAVKNDAENAQQTTNMTASIAPVTTTISAAQSSMPVAASVVSAPLGSHEWQQNFSQHVTLFTRQGQQSAELRLHPEELGQVQISIKLEDNQAQLHLVSAHSHVRQALEAALPILRTQLAENGIQLGQSNISSESFAGQQQQQSARQQHTSHSGSGDLFGADNDDALIVPASLQAAARGDGAVDIFA